MKLLLTSAPLALLLFFGVSLTTHAQSHADFVYDAYVSKHFDQSLALALEADAGLGATSDADSASTDTSLEVNLSGEGDMDTGSETTDSMNGNGRDSETAGFGAAIMLNRASLSADGDMSARAEGENRVLTPLEVESRSDLEAYASSRMATTDRIENAEFSGERMRVSFKEDGRFLGFIPVTMTSHAEVNADGSVKVTRPWYGFMVATDASADGDLESRIEAATRASSELMAETSGTASLSASTQAQILDVIVASLESSTQASASGSIEN